MVRNASSILVVDGLSETTEVLKAVLEPRGHSVNRLRQSELTDLPRPSLVIWHDEDSSPVAAETQFVGVPQIVIGRARVAASSLANRRFSPPFHYGELLQAIESLLAPEPVSSLEAD